MPARYGSLAVLLLVVVAAAYLAGSFEAGEWYYVKLSKPAWTPPGAVLGAGWAVAYLLMALAAWQVWLGGHYARLGALTWCLLLVLTVAWSALFFGLHRIGWAWLEMGLALAIALFCVLAFRPLSKQAAWLMVPVLLWLGFIWVWNLVLWTINGGPLARFL
ncbi:MAG: TspO/MBR family protein [Lysobacterales bacterium]